MNVSSLVRIDDFRWQIPPRGGQRVPVIIFGTRKLVEEMDEKVAEQASNVAKLPGIVAASMAMPDAHWGYGFPIGGVAAFDPEEGGIISAGGVGFDISCGVRCLRTDLTIDDVRPRARELADVLFEYVPAGVGEEGNLKLSPRELDEVLAGGARWALEQGFGVPEDLEFVEERGCMAGAVPENVSETAKKRQRGEMGTLGSGNHYCEVQYVERIYRRDAAEAFGLREGQVVVSIHCGSRGLGHQIGTDYLVLLAKAAARLGIILPDRELACAPINSPEGKQYIGAMRAGINCALANRQIITHLVRQAFHRLFPGARLETLYDVSHNTCKLERHVVDGRERWLWIHRKGATRSFGPGHPELPERYRSVGQPVIIGGSMGTASHILVGTAEAEERSFSSASHGSGRTLSRNQAVKQWEGRKLLKELEARGIYVRSKGMRGVAEEAPGAYKDVDEVARATEGARLADRVARLLPIACVKG